MPDPLREFEKFGRTIKPEEDPTRTKGLRAQLLAQMGVRFKELSAVISKSIVDNDCFGLRAANELLPLPPGALAGLTTERQVDEFMEWLDEQEAAPGGILELTEREQPWVRPNLEQSFGKGVVKGNKDVRALAGEPIPPVRGADVGAVLALPPMESALNREVLRTWRGLTGVAQEMNTQVARVLIDGLEAGLAPLEVARAINDRVDKIGRTRSELIARTEIVRAHNLGSVAEYARAEATLGEPVLTQWHATLDNRVRDNHIVRHGRVFERDQALQLIGEPNCRCALLPYIESVEGAGDDGTAAEFLDLTPGEARKRAARIRKEEGLRDPQGTPGKRARKVPRSAAPMEMVGTLADDQEGAKAFLSAVDRAWAALPAKIQNKIINNGTTIRLARYLTEARPDLKGKRPRGWPKGTTWDGADGLNNTPTGEVVVAHRVRLKGEDYAPGRADYVLHHELGHSLDGAGKVSISDKPGFIKAYTADVDNLTAPQREEFAYLLQTGKAGRQEAFADVFAWINGTESGGRKYDNAFPNLVKWVKGEAF